MIQQPGGSVEMAADVPAAVSWLNQLHGDTPGLIHVCSTGNWSGASCRNAEEAGAFIRMMDARGAQGIYVRATTIRGKLAPGTRGSVADSAGLSALWADVDFAGPGHKTDKPLPPTVDDAFELVVASGLPEPTIWVHSGGGLYPFWQLQEPVALDGGIEFYSGLSRRWHAVIAAAAERLGWFYGTETADLARVLRVPGTINRKVPGASQLVTITGGGSGRLYAVDELEQAVTRAEDPPPPIPAPPAPAPEPVPSQEPAPLSSPPDHQLGLSPGDAFEQNVTWDQLLTNWGWSLFKDHGNSYKEWTRPGKNPREGSSATTGRDGDRDRLYVFSSSTPFETNVPYNKFAAYTVMEHGGDFSAAALHLREQGYGSGSHVATVPDEWVPSGSNSLTPVTEGQAQKKLQRSGYVTRQGLSAKTLWGDVKEQGMFATDQGQNIYRYQDGVWSRDGERSVRAIVQELLGEDYRMAHASTVVDMFRNQEPLFNDRSIDTDFINTPNGLLEWRTGNLHPHNHRVPSMNQIPVQWNPSATCPRIDKWIREVVPEDCIETIYEIAGYCLFNGNPFHKAIMLHAQGRNGKGTFIRLLGALVGQDNYTSQSPQILDTNRFRAAELHGMLANLVGDVDPKTFTATEMFKQLTGEDVVSVERKNKDPFKMKCRALMVCSFNELPTSADATAGFFSRWIVVPFTGYFPPGVANGRVEQQLHDPTELEGFLVRAVEGLQRLMSRPDFAVSENTNRATELFRLSADPVRAFLSEQKEYVQIDGFTPRNKIYQAYTSWAAENGHKQLSAVKFYQRTENCSWEVLGIQLTPWQHRGTRGFKGIQLPDQITMQFGLNQYIN